MASKAWSSSSRHSRKALELLDTGRQQQKEGPPDFWPKRCSAPFQRVLQAFCYVLYTTFFETPQCSLRTASALVWTKSLTTLMVQKPMRPPTSLQQHSDSLSRAHGSAGLRWSQYEGKDNERIRGWGI